MGSGMGWILMHYPIGRSPSYDIACGNKISSEYECLSDHRKEILKVFLQLPKTKAALQENLCAAFWGGGCNSIILADLNIV